MKNIVQKMISKYHFVTNESVVKDLAFYFANREYNTECYNRNNKKEFKISTQMYFVLSNLLKINRLRVYHRIRFATQLICIFGQITGLTQINLHETKPAFIRFLNIIKTHIKSENNAFLKSWFLNLCRIFCHRR